VCKTLNSALKANHYFIFHVLRNRIYFMTDYDNLISLCFAIIETLAVLILYYTEHAFCLHIQVLLTHIKRTFFIKRAFRLFWLRIWTICFIMAGIRLVETPYD